MKEGKSGLLQRDQLTSLLSLMNPMDLLASTVLCVAREQLLSIGSFDAVNKQQGPPGACLERNHTAWLEH